MKIVKRKTLFKEIMLFFLKADDLSYSPISHFPLTKSTWAQVSTIMTEQFDTIKYPQISQLLRHMI